MKRRALGELHAELREEAVQILPLQVAHFIQIETWAVRLEQGAPNDQPRRLGHFGFGARAEVAKPSGLIVGRALFETYSPRLDLNEVGYLQRQNLHRLFTQLGVQFSKCAAFHKTKTTAETLD